MKTYDELDFNQKTKAETDVRNKLAAQLYNYFQSGNLNGAPQDLAPILDAYESYVSEYLQSAKYKEPSATGAPVIDVEAPVAVEADVYVAEPDSDTSD